MIQHGADAKDTATAATNTIASAASAAYATMTDAAEAAFEAATNAPKVVYDTAAETLQGEFGSSLTLDGERS